MKLSYLGKAVRAYREGRLGDAAAYKGLIIGARGRPEFEAAVSALREPLPTIDLVALRKLPPGAFGRVYADHMDHCSLSPLTFSDGCRDDLRGKPIVAPRYTLFHDAFHVLLDYDTSLEGECAVWSFVGAQGYSRAFDKAGLSALLAYTIVRPWRRKGFAKAYREGRERGRRASAVLSDPLEIRWSQPIEDVRRELGLRAQ